MLLALLRHCIFLGPILSHKLLTSSNSSSIWLIIVRANIQLKPKGFDFESRTEISAHKKPSCLHFCAMNICTIVCYPCHKLCIEICLRCTDMTDCKSSEFSAKWFNLDFTLQCNSTHTLKPQIVFSVLVDIYLKQAAHCLKKSLGQFLLMNIIFSIRNGAFAYRIYCLWIVYIIGNR